MRYLLSIFLFSSHASCILILVFPCLNSFFELDVCTVPGVPLNYPLSARRGLEVALSESKCTVYSELAAHNTRSASFCTPTESSVAFFGAVDNRAYLYLLTVTLLSTHRFHPKAGYFVLLPRSEVDGIEHDRSHPFHSWSKGLIRTLWLDQSVSSPFVKTGGYSSYTFLRHAVPEMLHARGFTWSVNLDPDVLALHPWDLRVFLGVRMIAGRPVGRGSRTARWLQERLDANVRSTATKGSIGLASRQLTTVEELMSEVLNTTTKALERTPEINGGVLVFNNQAAARAQWFKIFTARYSLLRGIIEGDQDLISLILASNLSLPRSSLPTTYNYAFRRDRERLLAESSKRLRAGIFEKVAVNIHFVADGKPWQYQNLTLYPDWLATARIWFVHQWQTLAASLRPSPLAVLSKEELTSLGGFQWSQFEEVNGPLLGVTDSETRMICRCFLNDLSSRGDKADPLSYFTPISTEVEENERALIAWNNKNLAQREQLLRICGSTSPPRNETSACTARRQVIAKRGVFNANRTMMNSTITNLYPAFLKFLEDHKAAPVKSKFADMNQCRLAHWFARIKQESTPPRLELNRELGAATVNALVARVATLPKLRKPPGSTEHQGPACVFRILHNHKHDAKMPKGKSAKGKSAKEK